MRFVICFLFWAVSLSMAYADGVSRPLRDPTVAAPLSATSWQSSSAAEDGQQASLLASNPSHSKSMQSPLTTIYDGVTHSVADAQSGIAWEHVAVAGGLLIAMFVAGN